MKRYMLLLFLVISTLVTPAQIPVSNEFVLAGEIKDSKSEIIYLLHTNNAGNRERDSCWLQNGRFTFKGSISEPTFAILKTNKEIMADAENKNIATVFLEPAKMTAHIVYDHFDEMTFTGSKTNDEYTALNKKHKFINEKYADSLFERHSELSEEYIFTHKDSYLSAYQLATYKGRWSYNTVRYLYTRLNPTIREGLYGKEVKAFLDGLDANAEGRVASDFIAKDVRGETLKLSGFKGKYTLLDFWGSWCIPCRESSPHLVELYKKYAEKGFTVIGVATEYEQTDAKWKQAIQKDGTDIWHNVLSKPLPGSPGRFTKDIAGMFGVYVFPTKILIDPCGFIIGRFHGTEDDSKLDEQLKEIFNNR